MIIGNAILGPSYTVGQLIVGRIVTGIGNGMNSSTAPVYLSECSPASHRGVLNTFQGTVTILGVVIAYWLDYGLSFSSSSIQWRFPLAFQAVFAILLVLQVIGLPETPRWLVQRDRLEDAKTTVTALLGTSEDDPKVTGTLLDIRSVVEKEHKGGPFKFKELFSIHGTQNFRRLMLTISVQFGQQLSGSKLIVRPLSTSTSSLWYCLYANMPHGKGGYLFAIR